MASILRSIAKRLAISKFDSLASNLDKQAIQDCDINAKPYNDIPTKHSYLPSNLDLILGGGPAYLHQHCDKRHREMGPIYREYLGNVELVFLADTKLIQAVLANEGRWPHHNVPAAWTYFNRVNNIDRGLFFQLGEPWARLRKVFNKVLLADVSNITRFSEQLMTVNSDLMDYWQRKFQSSTQQNIILDDIKVELDKWSIESTGLMLFGSRMGCIQSENGLNLNPKADELVENVAAMFAETSNFQIIPVNLAHRLNLNVWKRFEKASSNMIQIAGEYANEYIGRVRKENYFSDSLLKDIMKLDALTDEEISRSLVDLIIASADTTSNSLQWLLYMIAKRRDVQMKILDEVSPILEKPTGSSELLQNAPYLRAFVKETSRLYPTAPFLARSLEKEITLAGYSIPAGTPLVFSLYTTSRSSKYFEHCLEFKPERWLRNNAHPYDIAKNHAYASLPFGIGARNCIGRRLAELEMYLFIAAYVRRFESSLACDDNIQIKLKMISCPEKPISIKLSQRF